MAASGHRRRLRRKRKIHYVFCSLLTKAAAGGGFPGSIFGRFSTSRERPGPKTQGPWAHRHPFQNCTRKNPHHKPSPNKCRLAQSIQLGVFLAVRLIISGLDQSLVANGLVSNPRPTAALAQRLNWSSSSCQSSQDPGSPRFDLQTAAAVGACQIQRFPTD